MSSTITQLKHSNNRMSNAGVTVYLAAEFGFCWGVENALAYEAVSFFPDKKLPITNELIHNPEVNDKLKEMNVEFIPKTDENNNKDFSGVAEGDVVILPAFGASFDELKLFDEKNVEVVDTTCPWVSRVWNAVDLHHRKGFASVIHGKTGHEETIATTSVCEDYVCAKNMQEQELPDRYLEMDTICDATQTRQDAITELAAKREELGLDFILVIGGWDSSNSQHPVEIQHHAGLRASTSTDLSVSQPRTPSRTGRLTGT